MKIGDSYMKRILMALGSVFCLIIAAFGVLGVKAYFASYQNNTFAVAAVEEISEHWSINRLGNIVHPNLLKMANKPDGERAFRIFRQYGAFERAERVHQTGYVVEYGAGATGTVQFVGHFENGTANVTVKVHEADGVRTVLGLHMEPLRIKERLPEVTS
jgi:hypothetical protein